MCSKNAIGMLQEIFAQNHKPLPNYELYSVGTVHQPRFLCKVKCGDITAEAVAPNKKDAKQTAAENALKQLGKLDCASQAVGSVSQTVNSAPKSNVETAPHQRSSMLDLNFIGKLNEYAARKRHPEPVYISENLADGTFKTTCQFIGVTTTGVGSNKKTSKQVAACSMWSSLHGSTPIHVKVEQTAQIYNKVEPDTNHVGELNDWATQYRQVVPTYISESTANGFRTYCRFMEKSSEGFGSTKKSSKQAAAATMLQQIKATRTKITPPKVSNVVSSELLDAIGKLSISQVVPEKKTDFAGVPIDEKKVFTHEDLKEELAKYGMKYKIEVFQRSPIILMLKEDRGLMLCSTGQTKEEAMQDLLEKAVAVCKIGYSTHVDFVSFQRNE